MSSGARVEVDKASLARLNAALNVAAIKARAAAEAALRSEVDAIKDDAQAGVPVRTGEARDGIHGEADGLEGNVSATARHSEFIEHGTYKDPAQPFMQPAAEKSRLRWPARAGAMIRAALGG